MKSLSFYGDYTVGIVIDLIDARICDLKSEIARKKGTAMEAEIPDDQKELFALENISANYWGNNGWKRVQV